MTLPCGCKIWNEGEAFYIEACELGTDCEYVKYVIEETARQGKPQITKVKP